jgi:arabinose-5-phosphate isomerase
MNDICLTSARTALDIEIESVQNVRDHLDGAFVDAIDLLASIGGHVAVIGIGKSGLIGRKIVATLASTGTPAYFLHPVEAMHGDLGMLCSQDVVIAISYSGKTCELLDIIPSIRAVGIRIIALTGDPDSPLAKLADITLSIAVPREACPMNLAPTSSTTATLALGDALAICLMEKKSLTVADFRRNHPGGNLGQRLALSVADIMHRENLPLAEEEMALGATLNILDRSGFGSVMITDGEGRLKGILTDGDIRRMLCRGLEDMNGSISGVMRMSPVCVMPDVGVAEVMEIMEAKLITSLPVVDEDGIVLGMVHLHDILGRGQLRFTGAALPSKKHPVCNSRREPCHA